MRFVWLLLFVVGCAAAPEPERDDGRAEPPDPAKLPAQGESLLGEPLEPLELSAEVLAAHQAKWRQADADYAADPSSADAAIWLGRRAAYLGEYRGAIATYSAALREHPDDARLYRHRGHRYLSVRELDRAIADFERAGELINGRPDEIEPDGLPNAAGIPTSTLQSNIWYHLGLARFVRGEYEDAADAYRRGLAVSTNPDTLSAMSYWAYLTERRLGRDGAEILAAIEPDLELLENGDYYRLLRLYAGEAEAPELGEPGTVAFGTVGFGLANWMIFEGRDEDAHALLQEIVAAGQWPSFGHLAAEAELRRMRDDG